MTEFAHDLDGDLREALDRWRQRCMAPARQQARAEARAALLRAVEHAAAEMQRHPAAAWSLRAGGALAAATAVLIPIGWNAPAGTPLHVVRNAREHLSTALAGSGAESLRLDYAEDALDAARVGNDREANLQEAQSWLDEAEQNLPANANQVTMQRMNQDRAWLTSQQTSAPAGMAVTTQPMGSTQPQRAATGPSVRGNPPQPAAPPPPAAAESAGAGDVPAAGGRHGGPPSVGHSTSNGASVPPSDRDRARRHHHRARD